MGVVLIIVGLMAVLFVGAFLTKRRFGFLGLALAAGLVLSEIWGYDAGLLLAASGLVASDVMADAIAAAAVILLPSVILLFHGQTYKGLVGRIGGATAFAVLAAVLLVTPLEKIIVLEGVGAEIFSWLQQYQTIIIGLGLTLAVVDMLCTKPPKQHADKRSKH